MLVRSLFPIGLLKTLFSVPGGKSSLGLPETVTRPGLIVCLNCRWLPLVATRLALVLLYFRIVW